MSVTLFEAGRPAEAMLAWQRAVRLNPSFARAHEQRLHNLQSTTSPSRFKQALGLVNGSEWNCPRQPRKKSQEQRTDTKDQGASFLRTAPLFATPIVVANVTSLLAARNLPPIEDATLVEIALKGIAEANAGGPLVDEVG
jgi:hypothetical protein